MKTYDSYHEKYRAWLEDRLTPAEAEAFEKELENRPLSPDQQAELETDLPALGEMLKAHTPKPEMGNREFFNRRIQEEIAAPPSTAPAGERESAGAHWAARLVDLFRNRRSATVATALAVLLVAVVGITRFHTAPSAPGEYYVEFTAVEAKNQNISATPVETGGAQVLWLNGLDWIDDNQKVVENI